MTDKIQSALFKFPNYGRSFNIGALAEDDEVKQIYEDVQVDGRLAFNQSKVLFVGDGRVGKTSLVRLLTGQKFREDEPSTEGIETKMCETKVVDSKWRDCKAPNEDEFEKCAAWCTALSAIKSSRQFRNSSESNFTTGSAVKFSKLLLKLLFAGIFLQSLLKIGQFSLGYGVFQWAVYFCLAISGTDFLVGYRYGTGLAILMYICNLFSFVGKSSSTELDESLHNESAYFVDSFYKPPILAGLLSALTCFTFCFAAGVSFGFGLRSGIAWGLCMLTPHELRYMYADNQSEKTALELVAMSSLEALVFFVGLCIGGIVYTNRYTLNKALKNVIQKKILFPLLPLLVTASASLLPVYESATTYLLCGIVAWMGTFSGICFGRTKNLQLRLGYLPKRLGGLAIGLALGHVVGLRFQIPGLSMRSLFASVLPCLTQPMVELYILWKVKRLTMPVVRVREAIRQQIGGEKRLATRLTLWDFAGQELYYSTHHVFFSGPAVYIIVFNLEEAATNREKQLKRILFWLNSVFTHAEVKNSVLFLVGTNRDSVSDEERSDVISYLTEELARVRNISSRLATNSDRSFVFQVENSKSPDEDAHNLQKRVLEEIEKTEYIHEKYPIKVTHFSKLIRERRNREGAPLEAEIITPYERLKDLVKTMYSFDEDDFEKTLDYYHKSGDIIYTKKNNILKNYVILDPHVLVNIMNLLISIPPKRERPWNLANSWEMMENKGVADNHIMTYISDSVGVSTDIVVSLLTAYDLLCKIPGEPSNDTELYMVPSILPVYSGKEEELAWTPALRTPEGSDDVYYLDFGAFLPNVVFSQLVARCMTSSLKTSTSSLRRHVYRDLAWFSFDRHVTFTLELVAQVQGEQNLIKVAVQRAFGTDSRNFLKWLLEQIDVIRGRDFECLEYTLGVLCPFEDHNDHVDSKRLHIVELAGSGIKLHEDSHLKLLCEGRRRMILVYPVVESNDVNTELPRPPSITSDSKVSDIPPALHQMICDHMNVERIYGDWRFLAGELGHSSGQIQVLDRSDNPCSKVLQEWSKSSDATVGNLIKILQRQAMQRDDIVGMIQEYLALDSRQKLSKTAA
ncbi:uncharacterized protein [Ptychodera flava]|uniref:uncharacterized protein n=1 Tax=Ptychodera flava TaxID=63121 RepID=UPI003969D767